MYLDFIESNTEKDQTQDNTALIPLCNTCNRCCT